MLLQSSLILPPSFDTIPLHAVICIIERDVTNEMTELGLQPFALHSLIKGMGKCARTFFCFFFCPLLCYLVVHWNITTADVRTCFYSLTILSHVHVRTGPSNYLRFHSNALFASARVFHRSRVSFFMIQESQKVKTTMMSSPCREFVSKPVFHVVNNSARSPAQHTKLLPLSGSAHVKATPLPLVTLLRSCSFLSLFLSQFHQGGVVSVSFSRSLLSHQMSPIVFSHVRVTTCVHELCFHLVNIHEIISHACNVTGAVTSVAFIALSLECSCVPCHLIGWSRWPLELWGQTDDFQCLAVVSLINAHRHALDLAYFVWATELFRSFCNLMCMSHLSFRLVFPSSNSPSLFLLRALLLTGSAQLRLHRWHGRHHNAGSHHSGTHCTTP